MAGNPANLPPPCLTCDFTSLLPLVNCCYQCLQSKQAPPSFIIFASGLVTLNAVSPKAVEGTQVLPASPYQPMSCRTQKHRRSGSVALDMIRYWYGPLPQLASFSPAPPLFSNHRPFPTHSRRAMLLDDDDSASFAASASLPSPPSSTISSSSARTDSINSEISSPIVDVAGSGGVGIGSGGSGEAGEEGAMGTKVACTKSATLERREQQQSDLEDGDTTGERKGSGAGLEPSSSLPSSSSSSSRRFRWWGRRKARSWPAVLSDAEEGGKWEGGWGGTRGEAKEGEEAREGGDPSLESPPSISVLSSLHSSMQSIVWQIEARLHQVSSGEREGGSGKADEAFAELLPDEIG